MRLKPKLAINLLFTLLLGVVMVWWVITQIVSARVGDSFVVTADFADSGGVFTDQEVTYRGISIGKVGALTATDDGVSIDLLISSDWTDEIPTDVIAKVQSKSAVGEQFVNLIPRTRDGPFLGEGDTIDRADTSLPVDFQELLRSFDEVLKDIPPGQTRRVIENLAGGLDGRGDEIATIIDSLATLSEGFASTAPEQQRLLANATQTGTEFLRTKQDFVEAIKAADRVLVGIGDEPQELRRLFASNDEFARKASELLNRHGDRLRAGIGSLADFVEFQLANKDTIVKSLDVLPDFMRAFEEASVPWRSPDGRNFYRIRVGLVVEDEDNVFGSWPCKYKLPFPYHRFPHEREKRSLQFEACSSASTSALTSEQLMSLRQELERWLRDNAPRKRWRDTATEVRQEYFTWPKRGSSERVVSNSNRPGVRTLDQ